MKKILLVGLAASAMALNAPVAMADTPTGDCGFESVQQTDATGQNYEGVAYGYAVHQDGGNVSVRCYVTVNGVPQTSTPTGTGTGVATTQGRVTFAAGDTDDVKLCAEVTAHGTTTTACGSSTNSQIPPQEVIDAIGSIIDLINILIAPADPTICLVLRTAWGTYGPIEIRQSDGDLFIRGVRWWDCWPYNN